ncbi:putative bifunctional diguanylate cyclase/phosphodiesterase [Thiobacter aerophilum]|uniref:EAL domain-containing protein n=1 Tax=Thiobacter aerophilum TaxID=3121275 RepID=A0ABV0EBR9_9BURK
MRQDVGNAGIIAAESLTIATFKTVFPPLLIEIQHHLFYLAQVVDRVLEGSATPLPAPEYWRGYEQANAEQVKQLPSEELSEAWARLGQVHRRFLRAAEAALAAAAKGDRQRARVLIDEAFAASSEFTGLLVGGAMAELLHQIRVHERQLAARYETEFLEAAHMGRFAVRLSDLVFIDADANFLQFCGYAREELVGDTVWRLFGKRAWENVLETARSGGRVSVKVRYRTGEAVVLELTPFVERDSGEEILRAFALNVTEAEAAAQQRRLLATAMEVSAQAVVITDAEFRIIYANPAFTRITGYEVEEVLGKNPRFLQGPDTSQATRMAIREALAAGKPVHVEILNYRKDGTPYWLDLSIVPVRDEQGEITHFVSSQMDITERKQAEQEIARMALEDHLTGLPNRRAAEDRLALEWNRARRERGTFAIAIVDIDRFKLVNDQYGHHVGDQVLHHVAEVMASTLRGGDWVARWGGEEFIVCFHDLDCRGAQAAAERLRKQVKARPLVLPQGELPVTVSMGVSLYGPEHLDVDAMLGQADALLYEAKMAGRDRVVCARSETQRRSGVIWEGSQVQSALREGRVLPAFQTIVDLRTGHVVAEEALARIRASDGSLIPAQGFIQAAEALHLVAAIDQAISSAAMDRCARSVQAGSRLAHFINLSPQFLANAEDVEALLARARGYCQGCGLAEDMIKPLVIEITERQAGDILALKKHLKPLTDFGFRLALDDFGSGYSSFLYLAELPVRFLKIEGWMVSRIIQDARVRQLVETLVATARRFDIITIAECVESTETAQVLCDIGVDWAQGYYFSKPSVE